MDSLQPILPSQGIQLYGANGSGDGKVEATHQEPKCLERIEVLDEQITYKSGCFERGRRWLRGKHPKLGTLILGYTGWETLQEFDRIRPMATFTVIDPNLPAQPVSNPSPHDESKTRISETPPQQSSDAANPESHERPSQAA
jgi:hypothetical protein